MHYSLNLDIPNFLSKFWQQKPLLIKNAFPDFSDPLTADELAGMAMEAEISSRIVITNEDDWHVEHGPFEDFTAFGDSHWQLLVQAVNHYQPQTQALMEQFRFLPDWRLDDLMISFATPQGGVGPHIDNYDVFIIQGQGRRHWTVGDKGHYQSRSNQAQSALIEDFEPIIDVVLNAGDILYIPPGYPHRGNTLEPSLSYSIGFRAPSQQELFSEIADFLIDSGKGITRFTSTHFDDEKGLVSSATQSGMTKLLTELLNDTPTYNDMLGRLLSQNRFDLDLEPVEPPYTIEELTSLAQSNNHLMRLGGLKVLRLEQDSQARLFINGNSFDMSTLSEDKLQQLADNQHISAESIIELCECPVVAAQILTWVNQGYYYFEE